MAHQPLLPESLILRQMSCFLLVPFQQRGHTTICYEFSNMIPLNPLVGLCRLNRLLRCWSRCRLIGAPPIIMVAKKCLCIFKGHPVKTNRIMCKPLMGSHITNSLTQRNLGANKDNPSRDNLQRPVVRLSPIILNLLVTQANPLFHKTSLVSSKVTLLDKLVSCMFTQTNLMSSMVNHLGRWFNLVFSRANPPSSIVKPLSTLASLKSNQVNQLSSPLGRPAC